MLKDQQFRWQLPCKISQDTNIDYELLHEKASGM